MARAKDDNTWRRAFRSHTREDIFLITRGVLSRLQGQLRLKAS